jgi:micrococcal nuclease
VSLYHYAATLVRVIDGDTLVVDLDLGLRTWVRDVHLRLLGINCPELPTVAGREARQATMSWLSSVSEFGTFYVITDKDRTEKYGRWLATVYSDASFTGEPLNHWLVSAGHAEPYSGH